MLIECLAEKDLTPQVAAQLVALQHAAFPGTPEFVTQRWYHTPLAADELWFFGRKDGRMVCSVRVVHRTISIGAANFRIAGIANVGSHPDVRGSGAGTASCSLTRSFNSLLGLKNGTRFAGTSTRAPVFGLRPIRDWRWRVRKLPKPRISILSPLRKERTTLSKMASTMTSDSFRVISTTRETSSIRSAFVIPFSRISIGYESEVSPDSAPFASLLRFRFA